MHSQAKQEAQEALFTAIRDQAEKNMRSAMRPAEKAALLRRLAEAYRLTAGGPMPEIPSRRAAPAPRKAADDGAPSRTRTA
ncbi:hypothetical protein ACI798_13110 [Geodermatophilus sp. SYSU D01045]